MIRQSHPAALPEIHYQLVLLKSLNCSAPTPLKRPPMKYFRLPHGALIHPHQRNKISTAQCQNWERIQRQTVGPIQLQSCGLHLRRLERALAHRRAWVLRKMATRVQRASRMIG